MELKGHPDPDCTIREIGNDTSYIIKDSALYGMGDLLHMPMRVVTLSMFYVVRLCILHYVIPKSVLYWRVCYIHFLPRGDSSTAPEL